MNECWADDESFLRASPVVPDDDSFVVEGLYAADVDGRGSGQVEEDSLDNQWQIASDRGFFHHVEQLIDRDAGRCAVPTFSTDWDRQNFLHAECSVCVVGAGSLGCEILKNLVMSGFGNIHVIDISIVEENDLGRGFYQREDVGKAKAEISAFRLNEKYPYVRIVSHMSEVESLTEAFFRKFNLIINSVRSNACKRWLNGMLCSLVDVLDSEGRIDSTTVTPLLDCGCVNFDGYLRVILPLISACFECPPGGELMGKSSIPVIPRISHCPLCSPLSFPRTIAQAIDLSIAAWKKSSSTNSSSTSSPRLSPSTQENSLMGDREPDLRDPMVREAILVEARRYLKPPLELELDSNSNNTSPSSPQQPQQPEISTSVLLGRCWDISPLSPSTPSIIGAIVASECWKIATHRAPYIDDTLIVYGGGHHGMISSSIKFEPDEACSICNSQLNDEARWESTDNLMDEMIDLINAERERNGVLVASPIATPSSDISSPFSPDVLDDNDNEKEEEEEEEEKAVADVFACTPVDDEIELNSLPSSGSYTKSHDSDTVVGLNDLRKFDPLAPIDLSKMKIDFAELSRAMESSKPQSPRAPPRNAESKKNEIKNESFADIYLSEEFDDPSGALLPQDEKEAAQKSLNVDLVPPEQTQRKPESEPVPPTASVRMLEDLFGGGKGKGKGKGKKKKKKGNRERKETTTTKTTTSSSSSSSSSTSTNGQFQPIHHSQSISLPSSRRIISTESPSSSLLLSNTTTRTTLEDRYTLGRVLGRGASGVVRECTCRSTNKLFAVKIIDLKEIRALPWDESVDRESRIADEVKILKKAGKHPNIVSLEEVFESSTRLALVMEHVNGGELFERISHAGSFTESNAKHIFRQILSGIAYLHSRNVVHRDLKPENLLCDTSGRSESKGMIVKITDFGLSKLLTPDWAGGVFAGEGSGGAGCGPMQSMLGSPLYLAPEVLSASDVSYGPEVDLWSAGVVLYILLAGEPPFFDPDASSPDGLSLKILEQIRNARFSFNGRIWKRISSPAKDLISHMLVVDPHERYTAKQAFNHPWLRGDVLGRSSSSSSSAGVSLLSPSSSSSGLGGQLRFGGNIIRGGGAHNQQHNMKDEDDEDDVGTYLSGRHHSILLDSKKLVLKRVLDKGSFAEVFLGEYDGENVAVKKLYGHKGVDEETREILREIEMMRTLQHPNILRLLGIVLKPTPFAIVTEYCALGSLYDFIHLRKERLTRTAMHTILTGIASGLHYMHTKSHKIIHRDLKSPNVLLTSDFVVKIADFGSSKMKHQTLDQTMSRAFVGSPLWMAPEVIRAEPYNTKADVHSFAILMWEMCSGKLPYEGLSSFEVILKVSSGVRPPISSSIPKPYADLIETCWNGNPEMRPDFSEILVKLEQIDKEFR